MEGRTFPYHALNPNISGVLLNYAVGYAEAKTRPLADLLGCKKGIKNLTGVFFWNAGPIVGYADPYSVRQLASFNSYHPISVNISQGVLGVDQDV